MCQQDSFLPLLMYNVGFTIFYYHFLISYLFLMHPLTFRLTCTDQCAECTRAVAHFCQLHCCFLLKFIRNMFVFKGS